MNPGFVLDASIAMAWCFLDEATRHTKNLFDRMSRESVLVPDFWYLEIANVLVMAERKRRIDAARVAEFIKLVDGFSLEVDGEATGRAFEQILPLCRAHSLTSYDAVYLDLAARRRLPLATLDAPLRKAAKKLGIKLLGK